MVRNPEIRPSVTVVASRTIDRIRWVDGHVQAVPGGPGRYIPEALERLGCRCKLITGNTAEVQVVVDADGEDYVIPPLPQILLPKAFTSDAVILSPIMQEIDPAHLPAYDGLLAVDLQGFVRQPLVPSRQVSAQFELKPLLHRAHVLKAGDWEIQRLDDPSRRLLRNLTVFITRGSQHVTVLDHGHEIHVDVPAVKVRRPIGAGDAFLAAVVVALLDGATAENAARQAIEVVQSLLVERQMVD